MNDDKQRSGAVAKLTKAQPYMTAQEAENIARVRRMFAGAQNAGGERTCKGCGHPESTNCASDCAYASYHEWKYL